MSTLSNNTHYTNFDNLYWILQGGLKGSDYRIRSPKVKSPFDKELCTVRNSHKLTTKEKEGLSRGAAGGVRINLFTDRILAAHRGTRKDAIAELPHRPKEDAEEYKEAFNNFFGFDPPNLTNRTPFDNDSKEKDMEYIRKWLEEHKSEYPIRDVLLDKAVADIYWYNRSLYHYKENLIHREREERFILKKSIPTKPQFMNIIIEIPPEKINEYDKDNIENWIGKKEYLKVLEKHEDVFIQNDNYRKFKNYLRGNK